MARVKSRCCNRSTIIIAGALFVSPLAISAFRVPPSSPIACGVSASAAAVAVNDAAHDDVCRRGPSSRGGRSTRLDASTLSDSLDASYEDEQLHDHGGDVVGNMVVERAALNNGYQHVNGNNGVEFAERDRRRWKHDEPRPPPQRGPGDSMQQRQQQQQQQRVVANKGSATRKNNTAMADPDFLRKRTENLLRITETSYKTCLLLGGDIGVGSLKVDKRTFDWLIDAWSHSGEDDAANNALSLLYRMEELRDNSVDDSSNDIDVDVEGRQQQHVVSPDVKSYTKVINAIAHSGMHDAGERAEQVLERMISASSRLRDDDLRPNTLAYTYVIDAYARSTSSRAPHAAQRIVEEMERLRAGGDALVRPTSRAWNSVISAWAQWEGEEMAWGRIGSGAERAEACLEIMEELANTTGNEDVRPNSFNYNSVISALANSHDIGAASRAEKILERMENLHRMTGDESVKPRTATYNAIIDAWAKSGEVDAADRAELLLAHMMELYETGHNLDAKPNVRSFNSVLNAWAKSGHPMAPNHAGEVLAQMEELGRSSHLKVSPDATSFATVINAFARSHTFGKAERAYDLFMHMKELYDASGKSTLRPNSVVYNSVLNACAFAVGDLEEQSQAMEIANSMLVELNESPYGRPDQVTYGTYLKVINNQMPPSGARDQVVDTVFRKCVKDGMVGEMVLRQLREMGMEEIYENLVGRSMWGEINLSDLPTDWTCNVIEGKRLRRWQHRR